jgi:hypothetical protein
MDGADHPIHFRLEENHMSDFVDDVLRMLKHPPSPCPSCPPTVNVICPGCGRPPQQSAARCLPTELVRNGGFELGGEFSIFKDWEQQIAPDMALDRIDVDSYEGTRAAEFASVGAGPNVISKFALIRQTVTVTPGCFLLLSFAANFRAEGQGWDDLDVAARVYYTDSGGNRVNLINIEIDYSQGQAVNSYTFYQKVSDGPVPLNVSAVTVEFEAQVTDITGTEWLLDGVSLRAV